MRFARHDCRMRAAARSELCRLPPTSKQFSIGLSKIQRHIVLVNGLLAHAQCSPLSAVRFKAKRSVKFLRGHLADCNRKLDLFEIRQLPHAREQGFEQSASDAFPAC